jgi:hypothetical protein
LERTIPPRTVNDNSSIGALSADGRWSPLPQCEPME